MSGMAYVFMLSCCCGIGVMIIGLSCAMLSSRISSDERRHRYEI